MNQVQYFINVHNVESNGLNIDKFIKLIKKYDIIFYTNIVKIWGAHLFPEKNFLLEILVGDTSD